jgi:hypothetical protein
VDVVAGCDAQLLILRPEAAVLLHAVIVEGSASGSAR